MSQFDKAYKKASESLFRIGAEKTSIFEKVISYEWEHFGAIPADQAKRVQVDGEVYMILYRTNDTGGEFKKHYHDVKETGTILKGSVKLFLSQKEINLEEGQCYEIDPGIAHRAYLTPNTIIGILFHPPFKNDTWSGNIH